MTAAIRQTLSKFTENEIALVDKAIENWTYVTLKVGSEPLWDNTFSYPCFEIQFDSSTTFERLEELIDIKSEGEFVCHLLNKKQLLIFDMADNVSRNLYATVTGLKV